MPFSGFLYVSTQLFIQRPVIRSQPIIKDLNWIPGPTGLSQYVWTDHINPLISFLPVIGILGGHLRDTL